MADNMDYNFSRLKDRVLTTTYKSNLNEIYSTFASFDSPTITSGVGGSFVVSNYLSKVLSAKNNIICENVTHRDMIYKNLNGFKNVIVCSYGGRNYGVSVAFDNDLNKYLFARNKRENVNNITYIVHDVENSFISLAATLVPMAICLLYYCNDLDVLKEILNTKLDFKIPSGNIYEVLTGFETDTASKFIESTMIESGISVPIIHDKYDYCHGRSTLNYNMSNNLIFFDCNKELDRLYKDNLEKYYKNIINISKKYDDDIINDFYFTYISMLLCKNIAEYNKKDICKVNYSPIVKKLYYYKGEM